AYYMLGRYDEALGDLQQAQKLDPTNEDVRKLASAAQAKVDERIALARAKETAPETESLHLPDPLGSVQTDPVGGPTPTSAALAKTVEPSSLHARGRKLLQEDRYEEAIRLLTEALKLDPALAQAYNARGFAYYRLKQYQEAITDFDLAIKYLPEYANAY